MQDSLNSLFQARSIAIIGASEVPGKAAERRTRSLLEGQYQGDIYLINPKREKIFGRNTYRSIKEVDKEIDLVMIVVAPRFLVPAVADSVRMGARAIIIITAGLGETGEEGKRIEAKILEKAAKTGTRIIGPNCSGMFSSSARINLLGVPHIKRGLISALAQSGNVIDSLSHYAQMKGLGFSKIISFGNAIGVQFHEYIDYLKDDPDTRVIITYLEGIKDGNDLVKVARETVKYKPVIAIKVGRSKAGSRAAASHTGSLAGDDLIVDAALKQAGIIRVSNVDELFDMAEVFCACPLPSGNHVAILSEGGGDNSIAADNAEMYGLEVPVLSKETQGKIKPFLLEGMPASNPIDYGGTAEEDPHVITECVKVCMQDDQIDAIYVTGFFGGFKDIIASHVAELEEQTARELVALVKKYEKPLLMHTSFAGEPIKSLDILRAGDIPVLESSERTAKCLGALANFTITQKKFRHLRSLSKGPNKHLKVKDLFRKALSENRRNLLETESRKLLSEYGVPVPEAVLANSFKEALEVTGDFRQPLAMKVVSPDIVHKSDAGCVKLNLRGRAKVKKAFDEIVSNACRFTKRDRVFGILISPMATEGLECILGMVRDPQFGPVIMFGLGGIFVEVLKDISFNVAPLAEEDVDEMIREIRGYKLLTGIRGQKPKDIRAVKAILGKLSEIASDNPEIKEIDLNPVIVHERGVSIVDSRVILG